MPIIQKLSPHRLIPPPDPLAPISAAQANLNHTAYPRMRRHSTRYASNWWKRVLVLCAISIPVGVRIYHALQPPPVEHHALILADKESATTAAFRRNLDADHILIIHQPTTYCDIIVFRGRLVAKDRVKIYALDKQGNLLRILIDHRIPEDFTASGHTIVTQSVGNATTDFWQRMYTACSVPSNQIAYLAVCGSSRGVTTTKANWAIYPVQGACSLSEFEQMTRTWGD